MYKNKQSVTNLHSLICYWYREEIAQWPHGCPWTPTGFTYSTASDYDPLSSNWQSTFSTQPRITNYAPAKPQLPLKANTALSLCSSERERERGWKVKAELGGLVCSGKCLMVSGQRGEPLQHAQLQLQPARQRSQVKQRGERRALTADQHREAEKTASLTYSCLRVLHQIWEHHDNPWSRPDLCVHCYAFFPHMGHQSTLSLSLSLALSRSLWPVTTEWALSSPPPWISHPPLPPLLLSLYAKSI